jgi:hypothetical protein
MSEKHQPEEKKILVEVVRAFWPAEDERVNEGEQVEVSVDDALKLIEDGIAKRVEKKPSK